MQNYFDMIPPETLFGLSYYHTSDQDKWLDWISLIIALIFQLTTIYVIYDSHSKIYNNELEIECQCK